ncbi:MAG TPA: riboflavin kinase [Candidatus Paceibacterota bacterium]
MNRFFGIVQKGMRRGTALGFPTVNISFSEDLSGVYAGKVSAEGKTHLAAIFANQERKILEAYLFDFLGDLYGKEITIELHKKIREAGVFTDDETLKVAIASDIQKVREYFSP